MAFTEPNQPELTDEELSALLQNTTFAPPGEDGGEEEPDAPHVETPPPPAATGEDEWAWDDGLKLTRDQARTLADFDAWLTANPDLARAWTSLVQGTHELVPRGQQPPVPTPTPTTTPTQVTPPPDLDLDDPVVKHIWTELQTTRQQLDAASKVLTRHEQQISTANASTAQSLLAKAQETFQTTKKLNSDEMTKVRQVAERMNIVGGLMSPLDPITGLPRTVDPVKALEKAFDIAYNEIPEFRSRIVTEMVTQTKTEQDRKRKLTSLQGGSGSVPRGTPAPKTEADRRAAMIKEVADAMAGNSISE